MAFRNKSIFEAKKIHWKSAISWIKAAASISGNLSKGHTSSSIQEFVLLKTFAVSGHPGKAPSITQVNWLPPPCGWLKCNTDDAAKGNPSHAGDGGIFKAEMLKLQATLLIIMESALLFMLNC